MRNFNPKITTFLTELSDLGIGKFLVSSDFHYLCLNATWNEKWYDAYTSMQYHSHDIKNRLIDLEYMAIEALEFLLRKLRGDYVEKETLNKIIYDILENYILWTSKKGVLPNFDNAFKYSQLLNFNVELLEKLRILHAEQQASLASQAEQQASLQVTVLPTLTPKEVIKESIIGAVEKNNYLTATSLLRKQSLNIVQKNTLSKLEQEFVSEGINGSFTQRFLVFVNIVFNEEQQDE